MEYFSVNILSHARGVAVTFSLRVVEDRHGDNASLNCEIDQIVPCHELPEFQFRTSFKIPFNNETNKCITIQRAISEHVGAEWRVSVSEPTAAEFESAREITQLLIRLADEVTSSSETFGKDE